MRQIDELHLQYPFAGSRMLRDLLRLNGASIGRKHVASLMRRMGIEALYRRPRTTKPHPGHKVFPYLLRNRQITAPNQVWAMDISYIPMRRGFVYLAAVLDWATRRVLAWRLSNSMTVDFCLEAVEAAIRDYGTPEILNTDQGSQFTDTDFVGLVQQHGIQISMDGKGSWRDNVFVERLWKSLKYEEVYLHAYDSVGEARKAFSAISHFTTSVGRIPRLTVGHRIWSTSPRYPKGGRRNRQIPLSQTRNLFKQAKPPHFFASTFVCNAQAMECV